MLDSVEQFVNVRILSNTKSFYDTIKKNNISLGIFKAGTKKVLTKTKSQLNSMKSDVQLFSRMYIACQSRDGNLDNFFEHENHPWPPSIADNDVMRFENKAELLMCLEPLVPKVQDTPEVEVKILDGAALIQMLNPTKATIKIKTFKDYSQYVFIPYLLNQLTHVKRLDVVWDIYKCDSLKYHLRQKRGTGESVRVTEATNIPKNWKIFLLVDSNKTRLFNFIATEIQSTVPPDGNILVSTHKEDVFSSPPTNIININPCMWLCGAVF